jgi:hypothetical protein
VRYLIDAKKIRTIKNNKLIIFECFIALFDNTLSKDIMNNGIAIII